MNINRYGHVARGRIYVIGMILWILHAESIAYGQDPYIYTFNAFDDPVDSLMDDSIIDDYHGGFKKSNQIPLADFSDVSLDE